MYLWIIFFRVHKIEAHVRICLVRFCTKRQTLHVQAIIVMFSKKKKTYAVINCTRFRTIQNSFCYFQANMASFLPKKKSEFQHTFFLSMKKPFCLYNLCVFVYLCSILDYFHWLLLPFCWIGFNLIFIFCVFQQTKPTKHTNFNRSLN